MINHHHALNNYRVSYQALHWAFLEVVARFLLHVSLGLQVAHGAHEAHLLSESWESRALRFFRLICANQAEARLWRAPCALEVPSKLGKIQLKQIINSQKKYKQKELNETIKSLNGLPCWPQPQQGCQTAGRDGVGCSATAIAVQLHLHHLSCST